METTCPTCSNENLTDFPVCPTCAITRHFEYRKDCRCSPCQVERGEVVDIGGLNDVPRLTQVNQLAIRILMNVSQLKDDQAYTKDQAVQEVETIIRECIEVLDAASLIKAAIKHSDPKFIREGLISLENHTEGYWHRLSIGNGVGNVREHLADLEEPYSVTGEKAAA